jgi:hypothetical protein
MRVQDVTRTSFKLAIQEYPNQEQNHNAETVSYMIVEQGVHTLKDGTVVEAGYTTANGKYTKVNYRGKFKNAPVVLTQISTKQGKKVYTSRLNGVTTKRFAVKMQAAEGQ